MTQRQLWVRIRHMPPDSALAAALEKVRADMARAREDQKTVDFIARREARQARLREGGS
jgi:hypothetical protein